MATSLDSLTEQVDAVLETSLDPERYRDRSVVLALPDATRPLPYGPVLEPLLSRLGAAREVMVVIALGLHRPMRTEELGELPGLCERYGASWMQHDAQHGDRVTLSRDVGLGPGARGSLPAVFAREVVEADCRIAVGTIEPHQYAGFSGGVKTLAIGCAGASTIGAMHGLFYLRDARTRVGQLEGNPFQDALGRLVAGLGPVEALQLVPVPGERADWVGWGPVSEIFEEAVTVSRREHFQLIPSLASWLHLGVPESKSLSFYQASRAATYAILVDRPVVAPGAWVLLSASCPEGIGLGAGERACAEAMLRGREVLLGELHGKGSSDARVRGGEQRAYVLARSLERNPIALLGAEPMPELEAMGMMQFRDRAEAVTALGLGVGGLEIEDAFHRLPITPE